MAYCPNKTCIQHRQGFDVTVQSEVDVTIVMKVMQTVFHNQLNQLVLLAGDGDFRDMVGFIT